ncbi:hypothetical protein [uncultured Draconibacterium sp.]|uniref:hypothetical protein n=1 Tax=uncultured Draconibacterium sp. TaxID=1573823 RepID=UPI003217BE70
MNKPIFYILYAANIALLIIAVIHFIFFDNSISTDAGLMILKIRTYLGFPVMALWIWSIVIWNRKDKRGLQLALLIVLIGIYTLYYSLLILKNGWLENEKTFANKL